MYDLAKHILAVLKKAGRSLTEAEIQVVLVGVHQASVDAHSVKACLRSIENALVAKDAKGRWSLLQPERVPTEKTVTPAAAMPAEEAKNARSRFRWGLCRECGHRTKVTRQDLSHASPPRCSTCGGLLELSDSGRDEHAESMDHARESAEIQRRKQGFKK
jgi:ribosomal protein S27E